MLFQNHEDGGWEEGVISQSAVPLCDSSPWTKIVLMAA